MDQGEAQQDPRSSAEPGAGYSAASGAALAAALQAGVHVGGLPRVEGEPETPLTMGPPRPGTSLPPPAPSPAAPDIDDLTAISRLKFRHLRTLDSKLWDEFAETMVPEATATYSEYLQFESRDAYLTFMRNTLGPNVITEHRCEHPEIDIDGDTASGIWYLADTVLIPGHNMLLRGAAFYSDHYVRCDDGQWRISHTGYERTYEIVLSLSDLPSLRLTSARWGLIARNSNIESVERDPGNAQEREAG